MLKTIIKHNFDKLDKKGFRSVSMPAISSGLFGFLKDRCAKILVEESKTFLQTINNDHGNNKKNTTSVDIIEFCIFDNETLHYFEKEFANIKTQLDLHHT